MDGETYLPIKNFGPVEGVHATLGVFLALAWISTSLRVYTRVFLAPSWGWDDGTLLMALVIFTAELILGIVYVSTVGNRDLISLTSLYTAIDMLIALECLYITGMMVLKVSIGIFFHRLLVNKLHRWVVYISTTATLVMGTVFFLYTVFQCGYPKNAQVIFENSLTGKCFTKSRALIINWFHAIINAATDLVLIMIPLFVVWHLHLSRREKWTVTLIFMLGTSGVVVSMVRLAWIKESSAFNLNYFADSKWYLVWSAIEQGLGITAISLATLRSLFRKILNSSLGSVRETHQYARKPGHRSDSEAMHNENHSKSKQPAEARTFWRDDDAGSEVLPLEPYGTIEVHLQTPPRVSAPEGGYDPEQNWDGRME